MGPPEYITSMVNEAISKSIAPANLKCHKPNAFHSIANEEKVLETPKRGHVNSHIHESHPHETLVQVKSAHENLRGVQDNGGKHKLPVEIIRTFCPMDDTR